MRVRNRSVSLWPGGEAGLGVRSQEGWEISS